MRLPAAAALLLACLALAAPFTSTAFAHATLEGSVPARGAQLERAPERVSFRFSEPVEVAFGAVRVYDQDGERVDEGAAGHPAGRDDAVAADLRDGLHDGTYTATYRVVSADSHPVAGGFTFTVGDGAAPAASLDELLESRDTGAATEIGFGVVRALAYLALALAAGGSVFLVASERSERSGAHMARAEAALARRLRRLTLAAAVLGALTSALGIVFQGAVAAGTSVWAALDPTVVGDVLETRFGTVWGVRLLAWLALAALVLAPAERLRRFALPPLLGLLCLTPALAGHASTLSPTWLLVPANVLHVVCMAVWVGGVMMLLLAVPAATRQLEPVDRAGLLAAVVTRFSALAIVAVAGLVASGTVQALVEVDSLADLTGTAFGRAILIKIALVAALLGLGAWNRQRIRPRLEALDAVGETPGATGVELRRTLRAELALMVTALVVTAALVSYAPALGSAGPFSASEAIGPARLELTVDPARTGSNEIHLYLFDRRSGRQYGRPRQLTVSARLKSEDVGPLRLTPQRAGPGHYVIRDAALAPAGEWTLEVGARVSAFDVYVTRVQVPIE